MRDDVQGRFADLAKRLFHILPPSMRQEVHRLISSPPRRFIEIADLEDILAQTSELFDQSEDTAREFLASIRCHAPKKVPGDPFSKAYREFAMNLYTVISGTGPYQVSNEFSGVDPVSSAASPFPYGTGSPKVVANDLRARATLMDALATTGIKPPARVVEFGAGWGNITLELASVGFEITAVEVDPALCEVISARLGTHPVTVVCEDMGSYRTPHPFDLAVFFESFHHSSDHLELLRSLHDSVTQDGALLFGAEPIGPMAYPWGPRLDGLSLWSMRHDHWLELGFTREYFDEALRRCGWQPRWHSYHRLSAIESACVATRI